MATEKQLVGKPYVEHLPDEYSEQEKADGASWPLGPGMYEMGFEINGAKFPLARYKGGEVQKRIKNAKAESGTSDTESTS